jgi:hypothetical protein
VNRIILFSFVFLLIPIGNSFATYSSEFGDELFIFVQVTIRNSDGTLIAYLESTEFTDLNLPVLKPFLDFEATHGNDPVIIIDGQNHEIIRRVSTPQLFDSEVLIASTNLFHVVDGKNILLARFAHDGCPVESGDTLEAMWTFVRSVS